MTLLDKDYSEAKKWLAENDYLKFQLDSLKSIHVGDKEVLSAHILAGHTVGLPRDELHIHSVGGSGKGKGHCANSVMKIFPKANTIPLTSFSAKALFYHAEDGKLDQKIIYVPEIDASDDEQQGLLRAICDSSSENQRPMHWTLDAQRKPIELKVKGRMSLWFSSETAIEDKQLKNRMLILNPNESMEQDRQVFEFQQDKLGLLSNHEKDRELDFNRILTETLLFEDGVDVWVPFAKQIESDQIHNRRLFPQYLSLLRAVTKTNMFQRKRVKIGELEALVTNKADVITANNIWDVISESMVKQVSQGAIDVYKLLPDNAEQSMDKVELSKLYRMSGDWTYRKLTELYRAGLINSQKLGHSYYYWKPARSASVKLGFRVNWSSFGENELESAIQSNSVARSGMRLKLSDILDSQPHSEKPSLPKTAPLVQSAPKTAIEPPNREKTRKPSLEIEEIKPDQVDLTGDSA